LQDAKAVEVLNEIGPPGSQKTQVLRLSPDTTVEQAVKVLSSRADVEYAEPNYVYHALYTPDDPEFANQWGLENTGQEIKGTKGKADADIDACDAWDVERGYSNSVTVAIIDTGCDLNHPDLKSKYISGGYNYAGISQTSINYSAPAGQYENWYFAQSIKGTGCGLTHVGLAIKKVGNPTGNIYIGIRTSLPTSDPYSTLASYTITPSEVSSDGGEIYKKLSNSVTLVNGQTYYIVIKVDNADFSNYYELFYNDAQLGPDSYVDGDGWYYNSTEGWVQAVASDFYFRTNPNSNPRDDGGHGTHCAGIAAAVTGNSVGVAGTCPGAKILPIKVLNASGGGSNEDITSGIYYAANKGVQIISMSLGGTVASNAMQEACTYAYNKGCTIFAAAGNSGDSTMDYPAGYAHVIGVGATTNKDEKASFSTYNSSVDVSAPGKDIYSTMPTYPVTSNAEDYSMNYDYLSGTSMACPMAAGVGALIKASNPSLSPLEVEQKLESTADDLGNKGRDNYFGYGRVNAAKALGGGPQTTWYLAEGTTDWGFSTYISVENPNESSANIRFTYMTPQGSVGGPTFTMPALSQATVNPADTLGPRDFSTKVECTNGLGIAVDRTMSWNAGGGEEGHASVGVTSPEKTWYLPEGSSAWGFECFLLIQNPNSSTANCTVTYMIEGKGPREVKHTVPGNSRATFNMAADVGSVDASIMVNADVPVIPERAMYRNSRREGHDSIGTTTPAADYYLAEGTSAWGFTTFVLIQNPNDSNVDVTVTYMTSDGPVEMEPFTMSPNSRKTINVNSVLPGKDFSTKVHGSAPIIAERAMYWDSGSGEACHDSIGMSRAHACFYLPDGQTSDGKETWTLVQNPNSSAINIQISYLTQTGEGNVTFTDSIPANSRKTYNMAASGFSGRASVLVRSLTTDKKIMVERAMYWNSRGAGTDTIGGYSG